jgi:AcrR family transcriptional regulator
VRFFMEIPSSKQRVTVRCSWQSLPNVTLYASEVAPSPVPVGGLRDIAREAVRSRLSEVAIDLFSEHGFDVVTVEQIAAAAGISARSFHRYFPSKEDAVVGDLEPLGVVVRDTLAARPAEEPVWESLLAAFSSLLVQLGVDDEYGRRAMRVIASTGSLRARNLEKHLSWAEMLTPLVAARLPNHAPLEATTLVQTSLVCLDVALHAWSQEDETETSVTLLERTFAAVAPVQRG